MNDNELHKIHKAVGRIKMQRLSEISKIMIGKIIHQMELAVNSWKLNSSYTEHILHEMPKGPDFDFIVENIKKDILSSNSFICKKYSFKIGLRTFTINAIYPYASKNIYPVLDAAVRKMYVWLFIANHFAQAGCSPDLTIYWYLMKQPKVFPREHQILNREHANSAFTLACPAHTNSIYIFRQEEWFKVFIHETFHSLGLDFAKMPEEREAMFSIFPVQCNPHLTETYSESWAEIINVVFSAVGEYPCKNSAIDIHKLSNIIENKMHDERIFSMIQAARVLDHNKLNYRELFVKNHYTESTDVFSYYILKSIVLFRYNDFIEWTAENNRGTVLFKKTRANVLAFVEFIRRHCRDAEYLRIHTVLEQIIPNIRDKLRTMRMSITE